MYARTKCYQNYVLKSDYTLTQVYYKSKVCFESAKKCLFNLLFGVGNDKCKILHKENKLHIDHSPAVGCLTYELICAASRSVVRGFHKNKASL